jgi:hypothetical protein
VGRLASVAPRSADQRAFDGGMSFASLVIETWRVERIARRGRKLRKATRPEKRIAARAETLKSSLH